MSMRTKRTAAETYSTRAGHINQLLAALQEQLKAHADAAQADPTNWGRAGDLGKVCSDLIGLVAFVSSGEAETIEAALYDAE